VISKTTKRPTGVVEKDNGYRRFVNPNRTTLSGVEGIVEPWRVAILRFYFFSCHLFLLSSFTSLD
jgi:hypothetical protein